MKRVLAAAVFIAACHAASTPAVELGRLFLSPAERDALDRARYTAVAAEDEGAAGATADNRLEDFESDSSTVELDETIVTVDGYVERSDGPATVWINGTDSYQGNLAEQGVDVRGLRLEHSRVHLPRPGDAPPLLLKPGQSYDPQTTRITDAYERRAEDRVPD
ncbi:MAG: hypothetical protein WD928_08160 [Gammaproteobacteria bacterium]